MDRDNDLCSKENQTVEMGGRQKIPIWRKHCLSLNEAVIYSGIDERTLREMTDDISCSFVFWAGRKRLIKRKQLEEYVIATYLERVVKITVDRIDIILKEIFGDNLPKAFMKELEGKIMSHKNEICLEKVAESGMTGMMKATRNLEVPIWEKTTLSLEEAAEYTGIGKNRLSALTLEEDCDFVVWVGSTKRLLKRKQLEEFLEKTFSI